MNVTLQVVFWQTYVRRNAIALNDYFFGEISSIFIGDWIQPTEENRDYTNTIKIIEFLVAQ